MEIFAGFMMMGGIVITAAMYAAYFKADTEGKLTPGKKFLWKIYCYKYIFKYPETKLTFKIGTVLLLIGGISLLFISQF